MVLNKIEIIMKIKDIPTAYLSSGQREAYRHDERCSPRISSEDK